MLSSSSKITNSISYFYFKKVSEWPTTGECQSNKAVSSRTASLATARGPQRRHQDQYSISYQPHIIHQVQGFMLSLSGFILITDNNLTPGFRLLKFLPTLILHYCKLLNVEVHRIWFEEAPPSPSSHINSVSSHPYARWATPLGRHGWSGEFSWHIELSAPMEEQGEGHETGGGMSTGEEWGGRHRSEAGLIESGGHKK